MRLMPLENDRFSVVKTQFSELKTDSSKVLKRLVFPLIRDVKVVDYALRIIVV